MLAAAANAQSCKALTDFMQLLIQLRLELDDAALQVMAVWHYWSTKLTQPPHLQRQAQD